MTEKEFLCSITHYGLGEKKAEIRITEKCVAELILPDGRSKILCRENATRYLFFCEP